MTGPNLMLLVPHSSTAPEMATTVSCGPEQKPEVSSRSKGSWLPFPCVAPKGLFSRHRTEGDHIGLHNLGWGRLSSPPPRPNSPSSSPPYSPPSFCQCSSLPHLYLALPSCRNASLLSSGLHTTQHFSSSPT